jgi:general stress protein 26
MSNEGRHEEEISKLNEMIKDIRVAMFTTQDEDGSLRSRPMATQDAPFDGTLWFFTNVKSEKSQEILKNEQVNVSYAHPDKAIYVSVSGTAELIRDPDKAKILWNTFVQAWFPKGPTDPDVALLRIQVEKAEYWDTQSSKMIRLLTMLKAAVKGEQPEIGKNQKLDLR